MKTLYKNSGFTLLEVIISIGIMGMLITIIYSMFKMTLEGYAYNDANLYLSKKSLHTLYGNPGGRGIYHNIIEADNVQACDAYSLRLNVKGDSLSYYINGDELIKNSVTDGLSILTDNVDTFVCSYYRIKYGNVIVESDNPSRVNLVHIKLKLKKRDMDFHTVVAGRLLTSDY